MIEFHCRDLCERFHLQQVYLAQVLGPRRHYLAGYGQTVPGRPQQLALTANLVMFLHGALSTTVLKHIRKESKEWAVRVQEELTAAEKAAHRDPSYSPTKGCESHGS